MAKLWTVVTTPLVVLDWLIFGIRDDEATDLWKDV